MASVANDPGDRKRILFTGLDSKRKTIRIGKVSAKTADSVARHIEAIISSKTSGEPLRRETAGWLADIEGKLHKKLVKAGLVEQPDKKAVLTVASLVESYKATRTDVKPATLIHLDQAGKAMVAIFGATRDIATITESDGADFYRRLLDMDLAFNTARRRTGRAKQYLAYAVGKRVIATNPFAKVKTSTSSNPKRKFYVTVETTRVILEACPSTEWRLIVALARFGGLRTPSEHLGITWTDIHWTDTYSQFTRPRRSISRARISATCRFIRN
jgi:hypothetical protein